jgi:hypothetical protein
MCQQILPIWLGLAMVLIPAPFRAAQAPSGAVAPKPARATLLVTSDLNCTWTLDGKAQGELRADQPVTVAVGLGEHLVTAATADGGKDRWKGTVELKQPLQKNVHIELKAVRAARLQTSQGSAAGNRTPSKTAGASSPTLEVTLSWLASNLSALQISGLTSGGNNLGNGAYTQFTYSGAQEVTPGSLQSCNITLNYTLREERVTILHFSTPTPPPRTDTMSQNCSFLYSLSLGNITDSRPVSKQLKDVGFGYEFTSDTSEVWAVALTGRGSSVSQKGSCSSYIYYSDGTPSIGPNTNQVSNSFAGIDFFSRDKEIVERIARAFNHAAELCRAKEPF